MGRTVLAAVAAAAGFLGMAAPANAVVRVDVATACGDPFQCVTAECVANLVVRPTDRGAQLPHPDSVLVSGTAEASGSVAAATQVSCTVLQDGEPVGGCTATTPGQISPCAGWGSIDGDRGYAVCAEGAALWLGQGSSMATEYCETY